MIWINVVAAASLHLVPNDNSGIRGGMAVFTFTVVSKIHLQTYLLDASPNKAQKLTSL